MTFRRSDAVCLSRELLFQTGSCPHVFPSSRHLQTGFTNKALQSKWKAAASSRRLFYCYRRCDFISNLSSRRRVNRWVTKLKVFKANNPFHPGRGRSPAASFVWRCRCSPCRTHGPLKAWRRRRYSLIKDSIDLMNPLPSIRQAHNIRSNLWNRCLVQTHFKWIDLLISSQMGKWASIDITELSDGLRVVLKHDPLTKQVSQLRTSPALDFLSDCTTVRWNNGNHYECFTQRCSRLNTWRHISEHRVILKQILDHVFERKDLTGPGGSMENLWCKMIGANREVVAWTRFGFYPSGFNWLVKKGAWRQMETLTKISHPAVHSAQVQDQEEHSVLSKHGYVTGPLQSLQGKRKSLEPLHTCLSVSLFLRS